jgi:hypothetical protein
MIEQVGFLFHHENPKIRIYRKNLNSKGFDLF